MRGLRGGCTHRPWHCVENCLFCAWAEFVPKFRIVMAQRLAHASGFAWRLRVSSWIIIDLILAKVRHLNSMGHTARTGADLAWLRASSSTKRRFFLTSPTIDQRNTAFMLATREISRNIPASRSRLSSVAGAERTVLKSLSCLNCKAPFVTEYICTKCDHVLPLNAHMSHFQLFDWLVLIAFACACLSLIILLFSFQQFDIFINH